jgi:hypothetical protein
MATENISDGLIDERCCDICYDNECDDSSLIILKCCNNSKKICIKCVNCLKTPICPYCRKPLDSSCVPFMNEDVLLSSSEPTTNTTSFLSWENFLTQENIIDPSLYDDSRRMRRMMRRLRYQYRQINTINLVHNHGISREQRRNYHRRQRENNRNIARQIMDLHNQSSYNDDIFFMD